MKKDYLFIEEITIIDFPVFHYILNVVFTNDIQKSREKRNEFVGAAMGDYNNLDGLHSYHPTNADGWIFFTKESSIGTIAHEIFHALWRMFKYVSAKLDNETFAYHLGYSLDIVLEFRKKSLVKFKS